MPSVLEFSPPGLVPPLIRPAAAIAEAVAETGTVRSLAGVNPELDTRDEPLPTVPSDCPRLSTTAKLTPRFWFCSRSTVMMTASISTWIGATSISRITASIVLRLAV